MDPLCISGLPDRYQARAWLARTPHGEVVQAIRCDGTPTLVALKLLRAVGPNATIARAMFRREVEALKGLEHPAIVRILDNFEGDDGLLGIELELVPGGRNLSHLLGEVAIGRLSPPPTAWRVAMAVNLADAVLAAHRRNVIHRDLKPANVLWNVDEERLMLADFGIAAVLPLMVHDPAGVTLRSFYTRPFASPEQRLQSAAGQASDTYGFALLVAALLAVREPDQEFEPAHLQAFVADGLGDLRADGAAELDVAELAEKLSASLDDDPARRPSMTDLASILGRICGALVRRPDAAVVLTHAARRKLLEAGFAGEAQVTADFNADLRVRLERNDQGERIKIFGRTLWAVLRAEGDGEACAVDAGQHPGPLHEAHRATAEACPVRVRLGRGSSVALQAFAREQDRATSRKNVADLLDRAKLVLDVERERLPVLQLAARVEGGQRASGRREDRVGQASGYEGAQIERVTVRGGFRLIVAEARRVLNARKKNTVRAHIEATGVPVEARSLEELDDAVTDWHALFDDLHEAEVLDDKWHVVGRVTRYEASSQTLHVQTDKDRRLLLSGSFFVKNRLKELNLRKQEQAIEAVRRGETSRADLHHLLADTAAHTMGDKPWVKLLQTGLTPAARVEDLVNRILASRTAFCLRGPPGTGKTTVIAEVVAQQLELAPDSRILVCSQANDAVANAIERILHLRSKLGRRWLVARDVREERAREEGEWSGYEAAYRAFSDDVRRASGAAAVSAPPEVAEAVADWVGCVEHGARRVRIDHQGLVQVWGTTTARSPSPLEDLEGESYDLVIIDEAAKATVGEVLVAVVHARRLLLVGDERQLPPYLEDTTKDALAEMGVTEAQAKFTLFEHMYALVPPDHRDMLDVQFRMHPTIGSVVSTLFYEGKVRNGAGTDRRPLPAGDFDRPNRVMWVDVVGNDEGHGQTSRANRAEREMILRLLAKLDADAVRAGATLEVAVIAAYRGQAELLRRDFGKRTWRALRVKAATVDSFQGREADVVLYSTVRVGSAERKFLADGRRFNVALSRARSLLVMVGDRTGARGTPRLQQLLDLIPEENQVSGDAFVRSHHSQGRQS